MFVKIEKLKLLTAENLLTPYTKGKVIKGVRQPKEKITPDVCMKVLQCSNFERHIRSMLQCIAELPQSEQAQFNDVVRSCFNRRQQSDEVIALGKQILQLEPNDKSLDWEESHQGKYLLSTNDVILGESLSNKWIDSEHSKKLGKLFFSGKNTVQVHRYYNNDDYPLAVVVPPIVEAPYCKELLFGKCCVRYLRTVLAKGTVSFVNSGTLPDTLEVSQAKTVIVDVDDINQLKNWKYQPNALVCQLYDVCLEGNKDFTGFSGLKLTSCSIRGGENDKMVFPQGMKVNFYFVKWQAHMVDFSPCSEVDINACCMPDNYQYHFADGAKVSFDAVGKFPTDFDVSQCSEVKFHNCDFNYMKKLVFRDGAKVEFDEVRKIPADLDISQCAEVKFRQCDLKDIKNLVFRDGAKVEFDEVNNLPPNLDFSRCREVRFVECSLHNQENLRFAKGAYVKFHACRNLPPVIDVSWCKKVYMDAWHSDGLQCFVIRKNMELEGRSLEDLKKKRVFWDKISDKKRFELAQKYPKQLQRKLREDWSEIIKQNQETSVSQSISRFLGSIFKRGER